MKAMFRLAGITFGSSELVWHDFRHDAATILTADLNTSLSVTKEITGHSNTQMLERYVNPQLEVKRRALRELAEERQARLRTPAQKSHGESRLAITTASPRHYDDSMTGGSPTRPISAKKYQRPSRVIAGNSQ